MADLTDDEERVLRAVAFFDCPGRDWFVADKRAAFDKMVAQGYAKPVTIYSLTEKGRKAINYPE